VCEQNVNQTVQKLLTDICMSYVMGVNVLFRKCKHTMATKKHSSFTLTIKFII